jgi:hypothetical protein
MCTSTEQQQQQQPREQWAAPVCCGESSGPAFSTVALRTAVAESNDSVRVVRRSHPMLQVCVRCTLCCAAVQHSAHLVFREIVSTQQATKHPDSGLKHIHCACAVKVQLSCNPVSRLVELFLLGSVTTFTRTNASACVCTISMQQQMAS